MIAFLRRWPGRFLLVVLAVCVGFGAGWLVLVRNQNAPQLVPFDQSVQSSGVSLKLKSMTATTSFDDQFGSQTTALPGASFVIVDMSYQKTADGSCTVLNLQGRNGYWLASGSSSANTGVTSYCSDDQGTVEAIFQVPTTALGEVKGLLVSTGPNVHVLMLGSPK